MKTFLRHKTLDEIRAQCIRDGVELNTTLHDCRGCDTVLLESPGVVVVYSVFNGKFFGVTPDKKNFSSGEPLDGEPWFDALLEFFLVA